MTDDELLLIYSSMRKFTDGMNAREKVLDQKVAALDAAVAQLQQLPHTLGKQTSQYIAMGVRQALQEDFRLPIDELVKKPLQGLDHAAREARITLGRVQQSTQFYTLTQRALMVGIGLFIGIVGMCFFFNHQIDTLDGRIEYLQHLMPLSSVQSPAASQQQNSGRKHGQH